MIILVANFSCTLAKSKSTNIYNCQIYLPDNGLFFDIGDLEERDAYSQDVTFTVQNPVKTIQNGKLSFNFCEATPNASDLCKQYGGDALAWATTSNYCSSLSSDKTTVAYSRIDDDTGKGLLVKFDNSQDPLIPYDLTYHIICKDEKTSVDAEYVSPQEGRPYFTLNVEGRSGCTSNVSRIIEFLDDYPWVFAAIFIVFGIFLIFYGARFFKVGLMIFGIVAGFLFSFGISLFFWNYKEAKTEEVFLVLFACTVSGVIIGALCKVYDKIGMLIASGIVGLFVGSVFAVMLQAFLGEEIHLVWKICIALCFVIVFIILAMATKEHGLIFNMSFIGSYLLVRGVGMLVGGFPDELVIARKVKDSDEGEFLWQWWIYIIGFVIGVVVSVAL